MKYVDPIRNQDDINNINKFLKTKRFNAERDSLLFVMGINTGLRISDLLKLKVGDVRDKDQISVKEIKTGKYKKVYIIPSLKKIISNYCYEKYDEVFLFKSQKGINKPIGRKQAYTIIREAGENNNIYNLGTHTLRKTFGYHYYKRYKDVVSLMKLFNHSEEKTTLRYIGIEQEELDNNIKKWGGLSL